MEDGKPAESLGKRRDEERANSFAELPDCDQQCLFELAVGVEFFQDLGCRWNDGHCREYTDNLVNT